MNVLNSNRLYFSFFNILYFDFFDSRKKYFVRSENFTKTMSNKCTLLFENNISGIILIQNNVFLKKCSFQVLKY